MEFFLARITEFHLKFDIWYKHTGKQTDRDRIGLHLRDRAIIGESRAQGSADRTECQSQRLDPGTNEDDRRNR